MTSRRPSEAQNAPQQAQNEPQEAPGGRKTASNHHWDHQTAENASDLPRDHRTTENARDLPFGPPGKRGNLGRQPLQQLLLQTPLSVFSLGR